MVAIPGIRPKTKDPLKELERQQARERAAMETRQRRERLALEETMRKEGLYYQRLVVSTLSRLGLYHLNAQRNTVDVVQVQRVVSTPEAHYVKVDTARLPTGATITRLAHDDALENLRYACGRMVQCEHHPDWGFWYVIERTGGVRGIPSEYDYQRAFDDLPRRARALSFVVGTGRNNRVIHTDLARAPHILVAGSTNMGKSVFVNNVICTLAQRNPPDRLQFVMIDLKGGIELTVYERLPHLTRPIVTDPAGAVAVFDDLLEEVERRMAQIKGQARNIESWNGRRQKGRIPYIVLIVDELAMLMLNRDRIGKQTIGSLADNRLAKLAATCRAAGIHIVAATQRPSVDVITGLIKANFPVRVGFACSDNAQSMTILDNGMAAGLLMPGRLIFHKANEYIELQGPFVSEDRADEIVNDLAQGRPVELHPITRAEVMAYALSNFVKRDQDGEPLEVGGEVRAYLPRDRLYEAFRERGLGRTELDAILVQMEADGVVLLNGAGYEVRPAAGNVPRYFVVSRQPSEISAQGDIPGIIEVRENGNNFGPEPAPQGELAEGEDVDDLDLRSGDVPVSSLPGADEEQSARPW